MTWAELKKMSKNGATIANHSDSHPHFIRQQHYETHEEWVARREREILFAESRIKSKIGKSHKLFAYPYGEYDHNLQKTLARLGYIAFGQQSGPVGRYSSPQLIPRFPFGGNYGDMQDFQTKVNSIALPEARIKVTTSDGKVLKDPRLPQEVTKPVLRIASPLLRFIERVQCFASGQGEIKAEIKGSTIVAQANRALPVGRSRYNCTAPAGGGRFYWYSQMFIRLDSNGNWYNE